MNKREEITDIINPKAFDDPSFKRGVVLSFERATLKITRVDRKNKRVWGEHTAIYNLDTPMTHYGHNVDVNGVVAYCSDCDCEVSSAATEQGERASLERSNNG